MSNAQETPKPTRGLHPWPSGSAYSGGFCGCCGSSRLRMHRNAGYDIDPSGEEKQHLETCLDCGAERFHIDRWEDFTEFRQFTGSWLPPIE